MNCQSCNAPLPQRAAFCPHCGVFTDARVEGAVERVARQIVTKDTNARSNYDRIIAALPESSANHFRKRAKAAVDRLRGGTPASAPAQPAAAAVIAPAQPSRATRAAQSARRAELLPLAPSGSTRKKDRPPEPIITDAVLDADPVALKPALLSKPASKSITPLRVQFRQAMAAAKNGSRDVKAQDGFLIRFKHNPVQITQAFNEIMPALQQRADKSKRYMSRGNWMQGTGIGLVFVAIFGGLIAESWVFGMLVGAAAVMLIVIANIFLKPVARRLNITGANFSDKLRLTNDIVKALGTDLSKRQIVSGYVDLSGSINEDYLIDTGRSARSGRPKSRYRHEWLELDAPLIDGTKARVSVTEDCKHRMGFWKRGRSSRKWKFKEGSSRVEQRLRVVFDYDPAQYRVAGSTHQPGQTIPGSHLTLKEATAHNGRVEVVAVGSEQLAFNEAAAVMRYTRGLLQRV